MAQTESFTIGVHAWCEDGPCGTVQRVVVDPIARTVTHLVVEPKHRHGPPKLVPVEIVDSTTDGVTLRCSTAEFEHFDAAEETQFVAGTVGYENYESGQVLSWPYFGLHGGQAGSVGGVAEVPGGPLTYTEDTLPEGEVDVRRGDPVYASDGPIGHVHGLAIDRDSHRVSHVLLAEGHLWGRKEVAIPITAVTSASYGINLRLSKKEVADLPAVAVDR
ncbi:MAG TPA: PRC-barrel domain-containing protein [Streptosporangiaceae bacterium]|nr:PRC-barrel domain-containing protein [Streptosporangiaceae bacterium]